MKTISENPDAYAQAESGVMFRSPELEPLFLQIDKRWNPPAQLLEAAYQLARWAAQAQAIREKRSLPTGVTIDQVRTYLTDTLDQFDAAVEELQQWDDAP